MRSCMGESTNGHKWRSYAECRGHDLQMFFDQSRKAQALALCKACSVRDACLKERLESTERWEDDPGIWGGTTSTERALMRRE